MDLILELPLSLRGVDADGRDMNESRVEDDLIALLISLRDQFEDHRSLHALSLEIDVKGGGCVPGAPSAVVGNGAGVARHGYRSKGSPENGGAGRRGRGCNCCCYGS